MSVEIPRGWCFRHGTNDREIWRCVVECDEYRMKDRQFHPEDIVLDVGAHIGCFSYLAWHQGATVHAFEPYMHNYNVLKANTCKYAGIHAKEAAVTAYSSVSPRINMSDDLENLGGIDVFADDGDSPPKVTFDTLCRRFNRIKLLKLDCEYSEFPILLTSDLSRIDEIVGEYHEIPSKRYPEIPEAAMVPGIKEFSREELRKCLESNGFHVKINHEAENIGKFFAVRKVNVLSGT